MNSYIIFRRKDYGFGTTASGASFEKQTVAVAPVNPDNFPDGFSAHYTILRFEDGSVDIRGYKQARCKHGRRYDRFFDEKEFEDNVIRWSNRIRREHTV